MVNTEENSGGEKDCNKCDLYGECDHQGAYQKDGKWCYEDSKHPELSPIFDDPLFNDNGLVNIPEPTKRLCSFCGREDVILYKGKWICMHGCTKPALKPTEPEKNYVARLEEGQATTETDPTKGKQWVRYEVVNELLATQYKRLIGEFVGKIKNIEQVLGFKTAKDLLRRIRIEYEKMVK